MTMLARFSRRRTSWELKDAREIARREFWDKHGNGWDLKPSVYEVASPCETVRACAEHSTLLDPERRVKCLDATTRRVTAPCPGATGFSFADAVHREILLQGESDLIDLVQTLMNGTRQHEIHQDAYHGHVRAALAANDPEWGGHVAGAKCQKWVKKLQPAANAP
jgi:hypothetical protein